MRFRDRLFNFFLALILLLAAGIFLVFSFSYVPTSEILYVISLFYGSWLGVITGIVLVLISLWCFSRCFKGRDRAGSISRKTPYGHYVIGFPALESMILKSAGELEGIKEIKPQISARKEKLVILLKMSIMSDYPVPSLSRETQETVKKYLEEMSGIPVEEIKVAIDNVVPGGTGGNREKKEDRETYPPRRTGTGSREEIGPGRETKIEGTEGGSEVQSHGE